MKTAVSITVLLLFSIQGTVGWAKEKAAPPAQAKPDLTIKPVAEWFTKRKRAMRIEAQEAKLADELYRAGPWKSKEEVRCSQYTALNYTASDKGPDLRSFCRTYLVQTTGFVRAFARCTFTPKAGGKIIPFKTALTCSEATCRQGAQACRKGPVPDAIYAAIGKILDEKAPPEGADEAVPASGAPIAR